LKPVKNISASVKNRLLDCSRTDKRPFNEILQYFSMERFLYRLSCSTHADRFILKGALMLRAWDASVARPTMDIDLLGRTSNEVQNITTQFQEIMSVNVEPDGITFKSDTINIEKITEDANYEGVRVRFKGKLDTAIVSMQVDIGFGDTIYPGPQKAFIPAILDFPAPEILCYSRESTISEKFEAMVKFGILNSRMKDFYDIWFLSRQYSFDGPKLAEAIRRTFEHRKTELTLKIDAFEKHFIHEKQIQWRAFCRKLQQEHIPASFSDIVDNIKDFLIPVVASIHEGTSIPAHWKAAGPWV